MRFKQKITRIDQEKQEYREDIMCQKIVTTTLNH